MSRGENDPAADGIEEGKRLIRLGGEKGLSLAERLQDRFHRLTWRTPIHTLRLRGRHPLKLIAVPEDPFFGDVERGRALLDGRIAFRDEDRRIDRLDVARPNVSPAFQDYLHSFAWLRDLSSVAPRAQAAPVAEDIMRRWLAAHADTVADPAWRPDLWGQRLQFWTAHAPLILSSADLIYRSSVLNTLARGTRHIDRVADKQPVGVRRVATWAGILTAGLLIPGGEARRAVGEAGIARALGQSVFDDGGIVSRSPQDQIALIRILAMLTKAYEVRRTSVPAAIEATLAQMVPALLGLTHGDHGLSSWQGGGPVGAESIDRLVEGTGIRTRPLRQAREWGYQRMAAGKAVVIVDAAPPPVSRLVEGGCASTLAFEMSDGPVRLVVNCGGARASVAQLPKELTEGLRTTAAHSTLTLADANSTAILPDGTLGRGVAEIELARQESEAASRLEASHDGYARRLGFIHRRQLVLAGDGRELKGEDMLLPAGRRAPKRVQTPFAIRFHLGARVEVTQTADGQAALLRLPGGAVWQFRCKGGALAIEPSLWIDGEGRPVRTQQLVVSGEAAAGGAHVSWALKRAG